MLLSGQNILLKLKIKRLKFKRSKNIGTKSKIKAPKNQYLCTSLYIYLHNSKTIHKLSNFYIKR